MALPVGVTFWQETRGGGLIGRVIVEVELAARNTILSTRRELTSFQAQQT